MEIKRSLIAIFVLASFGVLSQPTEEQLKFRLPDSLGEYSLLFGLDGVGGMLATQHSEYFYYDIYLDTPDDLLLKEGWSLRLRKRDKGDSTVSYAMQLKSEMGSANAVRFEIEEKELEFYRWVNASNAVFRVAEIVDNIVAFTDHPLLLKNQESILTHSDHLNQWLTSMVGSTLTPFHFLQFTDPELFTDEVLRQLEVKIVGKSHRIRGDLLFDPDTRYAHDKMPTKEGEMPVFNVDKKRGIWLLETSLDYAVFYSLDDLNAPIHLREFEVESKYEDPVFSAYLLGKLSKVLIAELGLIEARESKYYQVRALTNN